MNRLLSIAGHDLKLAFRRRTEWFQPLWFLLLVVALFPLGIGPQANLLSQIAAGVIWIAALLSSMLSLDGLFREDAVNGRLEQWLLLDASLPALAAGRILAHWLVTGLPVILISPLLAAWMQLPSHALGVLLLTLLLGTPTLSLLGGLGAALTLGSRRGGMLLALLIAPLSIPALVFATNAVTDTAAGYDAQTQLLLLGVILLFVVTLVPFAIAAALRIHLQE